jgi:hypothetical protein
MMSTPRSANELVKRALSSSETIEAIKQDPEAALTRLAQEVTRDSPTYDNDPLLYRLIVIIIGLTALIAVIGAVLVASIHGADRVPDILTALGSGAIGALAGFLTPIQYRR